MPAGVNAATVFHKALESGICIAPGTLFSAGNRYQNFTRISCGYPWTADIDRKVGQLGQIVCDLAD